MSTLLRWVGNLTILAGLCIFVIMFAPLLVQEMTFRMRPSNYYTVADGPQNEILNVNPDKIIKPTNTEFGVVIPKINANAPIISNVDPNNQKEYQVALSKGIAHAEGSALPSQTGNVFLFAHSAGNFWEANRFNAVFYLLNKLEAEDEIYVYYKEKKYEYRVTKKRIVLPSEVSFLSKDYDANSLVLMTCWPPGTTLKRVIIEAQKQPAGKK